MVSTSPFPSTSLPLVPRHILEQHAVAEGYDTRFAACARLLQSLWRTRRGLPIGHHKNDVGELREMGSRVEFNAALKGYNFVTPEIAKLARREAAYREVGAVIDDERLWANLLSSQPLTFNLFGKAKLDPKFGKKLIKALFPGMEGELESVRFEHSPGRGDQRFSGDGTAFDVALTVRAANGKTTFIAIEVKYSENLRLPKRPFNARMEALASAAGLHADPSATELRNEPLSQLFAQHILTYAMVAEAKLYDAAQLVLIAPRDNREAMRAAQAYALHLKPDASAVPFKVIDLETVIAAIVSCGDAPLGTRLAERYTDFTPVHALIDDWEPYRD